jgi:hypothetical protein
VESTVKLFLGVATLSHTDVVIEDSEMHVSASVANSSEISDKCPNIQDWFWMAQKSEIFFIFVRNLAFFDVHYINDTQKPKFGRKRVKYPWFLLLLSC